MSFVPSLGCHTPWGRADHVTTITDGIWFVGTPSHGGFYVAPKLKARIPAAWRAYAKRWSGSETWYEEDCAWAAVELSFPELFVDSLHRETAARIADRCLPGGASAAPTHTRDEDCVLVNGECLVCGVVHGDPCPVCAGRGFHRTDCTPSVRFAVPPRSVETTWILPHAWKDYGTPKCFPVRAWKLALRYAYAAYNKEDK